MSSGWNSTEGHRAVAMLVTLLWVSGVAAQEPPVEVASGEGLYEQLCASCHGSEGHGDGTVSHDVLLRPRDFALNAFKFDTDADWQKGTDADLANVIRNGTAAYGGSALMPPWNALSDEEVAALVSHIRTLQR